MQSQGMWVNRKTKRAENQWVIKQICTGQKTCLTLHCRYKPGTAPNKNPGTFIMAKSAKKSKFQPVMSVYNSGRRQKRAFALMTEGGKALRLEKEFFLPFIDYLKQLGDYRVNTWQGVLSICTPDTESYNVAEIIAICEQFEANMEESHKQKVFQVRAENTPKKAKEAPAPAPAMPAGLHDVINQAIATFMAQKAAADAAQAQPKGKRAKVG